MKRLIFKILIFAIFFPIFLLIVQSFIIRFDFYDLIPKSVSFDSYFRLFNKEIIRIFAASVLMSLCSVFLSIIISYPVARMLADTSKKTRNTFFIILLLPILLPPFSYIVGISKSFAKLNLLNTYLGVIISHIYVIIPYSIINITNEIRHSIIKYEEAAHTMGASYLNILAHVTLPNIKKTIISTISLSFIISFSQYFLTLMIGGGIIKTYAMIVFPLIQGNDRSMAATTASAYVIINIIIYLFMLHDKKGIVND